MIDIEEIIRVLERAKHEHYTEPEGLVSCMYNPVYSPDRKCDCGADEINAEIDALILKLKNI